MSIDDIRKQIEDLHPKATASDTCTEQLILNIQELVRVEAAKARQVGQYQAANAIYGDVTTLFMLKDRLPELVHRTVDDLLNKTEAHMNVNNSEYNRYLDALSSNQQEETE